MKNVIGYMRVSTDAQAKEDKFGLDVQREAILDYCLHNDMKIVKWISDEGESGAKFRPGFDEIVYGGIENPPYQAVVVAKSDRVARDINIYFYYKGALLRKGIELISVSEDFGVMGAFANVLTAFTLTCAEMERENITNRTSGGREVKASYGGYAGGRPAYGYVVDRGNLKIDPVAAEAVRMAFKLRQQGLSLSDIARELNDAGYKTAEERPFCSRAIKRILDREKLYRGMIRYGKVGYTPGKHEAILKDEWEVDD